MTAPNLDGVPDCLSLSPFGVPTRISMQELSPDSVTAVYIGRRNGRWGLEGSKWCNPFKLSQMKREKCIDLFRQKLSMNADLLSCLPELSGRMLACWCKPHEACNGDAIISEFMTRAPLSPPDGKGLHLLLMFSGPSSRKDSLAHFVRELGATCEEIDIENDTISQDLSDEDVWLQVLSRIKAGRFDGGIIMPTCGTFSVARRGPGPKPLRCPEGSDLYGLKGLSPEDEESPSRHSPRCSRC